jgi:hypothetical protein
MNVGQYYEKRFSTYKKTQSEKKAPRPKMAKSNDLKESLRAVMRGRGGSRAGKR